MRDSRTVNGVLRARGMIDEVLAPAKLQCPHIFASKAVRSAARALIGQGRTATWSPTGHTRLSLADTRGGQVMFGLDDARIRNDPALAGVTLDDEMRRSRKLPCQAEHLLRRLLTVCRPRQKRERRLPAEAIVRPLAVVSP